MTPCSVWRCCVGAVAGWHLRGATKAADFDGAIKRVALWTSAVDVPPAELKQHLRGRRTPRDEFDFADLAQAADESTSGVRIAGRVLLEARFRLTGELLGVPARWAELLARNPPAVRLDLEGVLGGDTAVAAGMLEDLASLVRRGGSVGVHGKGRVPSAHAFLFACCPGKRTLAPDASLLLHAPIVAVVGDAGRLRFEAERLEEATADWVRRLVARTGQTEPEVRSWLEPGQDVIFAAGEAVEAGLADAVL